MFVIDDSSIRGPLLFIIQTGSTDKELRKITIANGNILFIGAALRINWPKP